jgi:DNA-binding NtrC family response regulator
VTADKASVRHEIARGIHEGSGRCQGPFAVLNCSGPEEILHSLLFGHKAGSFADAHSDVPGWCEQVHRGTLVLDDVGSLSPRLQDAVVSFLDAGEVTPVGADSAGKRVDVRIISATNTDLHALTQRGLFREDLFYRLNIIHVVVPTSVSHAIQTGHQAHLEAPRSDRTEFL